MDAFPGAHRDGRASRARRAHAAAPRRIIPRRLSADARVARARARAARGEKTRATTRVRDDVVARDVETRVDVCGGRPFVGLARVLPSTRKMGATHADATHGARATRRRCRARNAVDERCDGDGETARRRDGERESARARAIGDDCEWIFGEWMTRADGRACRRRYAMRDANERLTGGCAHRPRARRMVHTAVMDRRRRIWSNFGT